MTLLPACGTFSSYWDASSRLYVMVCAWYYCSILHCVWLMTLETLLFSEWRRKGHEIGGEERWGERLGVGENYSQDVLYERIKKL